MWRWWLVGLTLIAVVSDGLGREVTAQGEVPAFGIGVVPAPQCPLVVACQYTERL